MTDSSITIETTEGVSYSIDGGRSWQTTGVFTGLNRDTVYSIIPKAVETKFYKEHTGSATEQRTEKTTVRFPDIADQTYEFDGTAKTFMLPKSITGISDMQITRYGRPQLSSLRSRRLQGNYRVHPRRRLSASRGAALSHHAHHPEQQASGACPEG